MAQLQKYPQTSFVWASFSPKSFIARKRDVVWENTILFQLGELKKTGRYDAFKLEWKEIYKPDPAHWPTTLALFWDSDVAKWLEGACYFLQERQNQEISDAVHELAKMIVKAQQPDGYLNIHFTVVDPKARFSNIRDMHEMYNCGHLIEAALAYFQLTGDRELLLALIKYAKLLDKTFGPEKEKLHGYPGHPELELALLRLAATTDGPELFELGRYFITERGNTKGQDGRHFYDVEAEKRGDHLFQRPECYPFRRAYWYQQAHVPILEQKTIEGHSVRAMYLLTGVADLVLQTKDEKERSDYREALETLWCNMTEKKMYLTGGIGAQDQWEGFGQDYFLPQGLDEGGCYAETCAAIGVIMMAERMLRIDLNGKYGDVMELCFYNAVLGGMSVHGKGFSYTNRLATTDSDRSTRSEWFTCACCPPNMIRLFGSIGGYMWTCEKDIESVDIRIHMFGSGTLEIPMDSSKTVKLHQKSNWPWDGAIEFQIESPKDIKTSLALRIPGWAKDWKITSASEWQNKVINGYVHLSPEELLASPTFRLDITISVIELTPHPFTNQDTIALARGPIVYCIEDVDNNWVTDHFKTLLYRSGSKVDEELIKDSSTGEEYVVLKAHNAFSMTSGKDIETVFFIPYYFRANRDGNGQMRVGLRRYSEALRENWERLK